MPRSSSLRFILLLFPAAWPVTAASQARMTEPREFLGRQAGLSSEQTAELDRGSPAAAVFESGISTELAPFGAIRVRVPRDYFLQKYRDIADFKKAKEVLRVGKFRLPPGPEDLEALTLEPNELDALRKCRPGDCVIKLSDEMIRKLQESVKWSAPDRRERAMAVVRRLLLDYVKDYLARGAPALTVYRDKKAPIRLADESSSILQASPYLRDGFPALARFLETYPAGAPPNTEEFVYWSKESFGYKPVVSITHTVIHAPEPRSVIIASRQLYATHYFIGSLGLAAFVEDEQGTAGPGAYLMYLNRTRVDLLGTFFGRMVRFIVRRRVTDGMERNLRLVKERLETAYRADGGR